MSLSTLGREAMKRGIFEMCGRHPMETHFKASHDHDLFCQKNKKKTDLCFNFIYF